MANLSTKIEDNICPICLCIFIQPVTMPCEHELCLVCFKQNVEEANFCCPMCRTRISTWARRAARNKTLVNEKRWAFIQDTFPDQVKNKLDGNEEEDEEMRALNMSIRLAEPGEIRSEYEQQLKQLQAQRWEEKKKELEASERLISAMQAEEKKKREELEIIAKKDEELARKLSEADPNSPLEQRLRSCRSTDVDDMMGATGDQQRSNCDSMETFIDKMRTENNMSKSPYPYRCLTPVGTGKLCVDKDKALLMEDKFNRQKIKRDKNLITTQDIANLEEHFKTQRARAISDVEPIDIDTLSRGSESNMSMGMSHVVSNSCLNQNEILDQMSSGLNVSVNIMDVRPATNDIIVISPSPQSVNQDRNSTKSGTSEKSVSNSASTSSCSFKSAHDEVPDRSVSAQSTDSISQELTHFRPIRSCPLTPPRKLPSGKVVEPQLIRTTPRNLNKSGLGSPLEANLSDIDGGSPIMQRRLSELAEERKDKVVRMSKCTSTLKNEENRNPEQNDDSTNSGQVTRRNICRSVDFKDISNSPINTKRKLEDDLEEESPAKRKLIIPLVPDLDDVVIYQPETTVTKTVLTSHPRDRLSKSKKEKSGKVRYTSGNSTPLDSKRSPQVSIMNWMKRENDLKTCGKNGKGDYFIDCKRDEVDGDKKCESEDKADLRNDTDIKRKQTIKANGCSQLSVKGKTRSNNLLLSQIDQVSKQRRTRRNRKTLLCDDFVYDGIGHGKKKHSVSKDTNDSSCDKFYSDGDSESSDESTTSSPVKRRTESNVARKETGIENSQSSNRAKFKPKPVLKPSKHANRRSSRRMGGRGAKSIANGKTGKSVKTMHDFFSRNTASANDSVHAEENDVCHMTQEEKDRKLAEELQKQFEMEAKLHLNSLRFKGSTDEYSFRSRPKNLSV